METNTYGWIFTTILIIINILTFLIVLKRKKDLKDCESTISLNCPIFTCETENAQGDYRPFRCPYGEQNTSECKNIQYLDITF